MPHDAFILAAGFGTRLRPLTDLRPKPLVPVCGVPMLAYSLALCRRHGLRDVVVNAHHLADQLAPWAGLREGVHVTLSVETPDILGTGGGLKKVAAGLAERVVVLNGDTLCDVDLTALRSAVPEGGGAMALRVHPDDARERYGVVAYDDAHRITDLKSMATSTPEGAEHHDAHFTGIHALDRSMLDLVPDGFACIVRTAYIQRVPQRRIAAVPHHGVWLDVGDARAYLEANLAVLDGTVTLALDPWSRAATADGTGHLDGRVWLGEGCRVDGRVRRSVIGERAVVPADAELEDCVVWEDAVVPPGRWKRRVFAGPHAVDVDAARQTTATDAP